MGKRSREKNTKGSKKKAKKYRGDPDLQFEFVGKTPNEEKD